MHGCSTDASVDMDMACIGVGDMLVTPFFRYGGLIDAAAGVALLGTVFAAVHHAEVIAHRVGEPFGTLILALAVTVKRH